MRTALWTRFRVNTEFKVRVIKEILREEKSLSRTALEYESPLHNSVANGLIFSADLADNVDIDHNELMAQVANVFPKSSQLGSA